MVSVTFTAGLGPAESCTINFNSVTTPATALSRSWRVAVSTSTISNISCLEAVTNGLQGLRGGCAGLYRVG